MCCGVHCWSSSTGHEPRSESSCSFAVDSRAQGVSRQEWVKNQVWFVMKS